MPWHNGHNHRDQDERPIRNSPFTGAAPIKPLANTARNASSDAAETSSPSDLDESELGV
jgi:hypothetical protein